MFLLAAAFGCGGPRPGRVLLVTIDTLRADRVGAYGGPPGATPNLDRLAARGVRFETALSPTPTTLPSHTSLLTGLDPPRHGVHDNGVFRLDNGVPTLAERYGEAGFETAAFVAAAVLDRQYGLARGFDTYRDAMSVERAAGRGGYAERRADAVVDEVLAWLEEAPARFFAWVHFYDPHHRYRPPPASGARFPHDAYQGEIHFADAQLGRLLAELDRRFPAGDTLVVVTSDHGESLGEHGELQHTYTVYDATQRVPLVMAGPGVPPGVVVRSLAGLVDVAPTLLARSGLPPFPDSDGRDLAPAWHAPERSDTERALYQESLAGRLHYGWSPVLGLRTASHRFLRTPHPELYDVTSDPRELVDRAAREPERVASLEAELATRLRNARLVTPSVQPDAAQRAQLESLGYVVADSGGFRLELAALSGEDPKVALPRVGHEVPAVIARAVFDPTALEQLPAPGTGGFRTDIAAAAAALDAGDFALAERYAAAAVAAQPGVAQAHELLGRAWAGLGRRAAAEVRLRRAIELDSSWGDPWVALGRIAEEAGEAQRAEEHYRKAMEVRAPSAEGAWRLAALWLEQGRGAEADALLATLPSWILQNGRRPILRLAEAEVAAGRFAAAEARLAAALRIAPWDREIARRLDAAREARREGSASGSGVGPDLR